MADAAVRREARSASEANFILEEFQTLEEGKAGANMICGGRLLYLCL
jgi:hypothetical protein